MSAELDTSHQPQGRFAPHGRIAGSLAGDVLLTVATGPFNLEGIEAYHRERAQFYRQFAPVRPYVAVVRFEQSMLISPEALAAYMAGVRASLRLAESRPPVACAWVAARNLAGRSLLRPVFEEFF